MLAVGMYINAALTLIQHHTRWVRSILYACCVVFSQLWALLLMERIWVLLPLPDKKASHVSWEKQNKTTNKKTELMQKKEILKKKKKKKNSLSLGPWPNFSPDLIGICRQVFHASKRRDKQDQNTADQRWKCLLFFHQTKKGIRFLSHRN